MWRLQSMVDYKKKLLLLLAAGGVMLPTFPGLIRLPHPKTWHLSSCISRAVAHSQAGGAQAGGPEGSLLSRAPSGCSHPWRCARREEWLLALPLLPGSHYLVGYSLGFRLSSVMASSFPVEWQVNNDQAPFFQQADGPQFPAMCNLPRGKANDHRKLIGESGVSYAQAEKACSSVPLSARESCIFDATTTGNLEMAAMGLD